MLYYPVENAKLLLTTDASAIAVGAVVEQIVDGSRQPLRFYSHKLTETQRTWSAYDRGLLAIYQAIEHFECLLQGKQFTILTDHKPLLSMFTGKITAV